MCKQIVYWASISLFVVACAFSIAAFSLSIRAGLTTEERIELNAARINISAQIIESEVLLEVTVPYQMVIDNTSALITRNKLQDVPTLQECESILMQSAAALATKVQVLQAQLDVFDLSPLDALPPLVDAADNSVEALAMAFQYTGVIQELQAGTFLMWNEANMTEYVNMTYSLVQMLFPGGARIYLIRIPPNGQILTIETIEGAPNAAIVFGDWFPPLALGGGLSLPPAHIDPILDEQRGRIDTTPSRLVFKQREYNLEEQLITIRDTASNFTVGEQVRVHFEIEMNVGFL